MIYDDSKFIGSIIKNARKKTKLTQEEFSEKVGMSDKNLGNIEKGKQFPSVSNFLRIIDTFNLSLEDFGIKNDTKEFNPMKEELIKTILSCPDKKIELYKKAIELIDIASK